MHLSEKSTPIVADLLARFYQVRRHTVALASHLSEEDCCVQSMPDASPVKWHLAHVTWFFETFILEPLEPGFRPYHPAFRMLFNSYYNGVGDKHVRAQRGMLTRPSLDEVLAYRHQIDQRVADLLTSALQADSASERGTQIAALLELGLQHEQQHQELLLTDVQHLLWLNPLKPAYAHVNRSNQLGLVQTHATRPNDDAWIAFEAGLSLIGNQGVGTVSDFCFDNELPRHRQWLEAYALGARLVTNADYLAFMQAGGYADPMLWLAEGWDWVQNNQVQAPLYWQRDAVTGDVADKDTTGWEKFCLSGLQPLDLQAAVNHLSYYEADAYARWCGARLPTEAEWEHAARLAAAQPNAGFADLFGSRWQWTSSSYAPYPGYAPAAGAIGEYNGKFMANQYVLRGSSFATPPSHARVSYRNFFPCTARWQHSGLRLAKSMDVAGN